MQGIKEQPRSKKLLKEMVSKKQQVTLQATSIIGSEYDGSLYNAPDGVYNVVGPDPFTKRKWYANITIKEGKIKVT